MSRWDDEFNNHAIHQTLIEVRECLDVEVEEPSSSLTSERRRLLKVLDLIDEALSELDPEITPTVVLNGMNQLMRHANFWGQVQAYKNNPDAPHLTNANAQIDSQLPAIYQLFGRQKDKRVLKLNKSVEKSFDDFAKTVEAKSNKFSSKVDELGNELAETSGKQEVLKTEMDQLAVDQDSKLNEWETEFTTNQKERLDGFAEAQTSRNTKFEEWFAPFQKETAAKAEETIVSRATTLSEFFEVFKKDTEDMRLDAENRHKQILELHGLVAGDGVVAGYVDNAESEKKQANFWRWVAIGFIAATALWLGVTYFTDVNSALNAGEILARMARIVPLTAVFIYGAVYASKQSSFHRNNEKQTRWFALEVKAIDPFIAALDSTQQKELKVILTDRLFGQNNGPNVPTTANVDPNLLKVILDAIKDVAKGK